MKKVIQKKKAYMLILFLIIALLFGCAENEESFPAFLQLNKRDEGSLLTDMEGAFDKVREDAMWSMEQYEELLEACQEKLVPVAWKEELSDMEWEEDIRPYMEYDWLRDEHIFRSYTSDESFRMQLADLNMDGQREMLVSQSGEDGCDTLSVYTVMDGKVAYCGFVPTGYKPGDYFDFWPSYDIRLYWNNALFTTKCIVHWKKIDRTDEEQFLKFWPLCYIDAYQNKEGEFRYLSGVCRNGCFEIYESTFDGTEITYRPVISVMPSFVDTDEELSWKYLTAENWNEWDKAETDDKYMGESYSLVKEYMEGYEKVNIQFVMSDYAVPANKGIDRLSDNQQVVIQDNLIDEDIQQAFHTEGQHAVIKDNIQAGFVRTMEGTVTDSEVTVTLGEKYYEFLKQYNEGPILTDPSGYVTKVRVGEGLRTENFRDITYRNFDDISFDRIGYNMLNGDVSGEQYILLIKLWTPRFSTFRGIRVGMSQAQLQEAYGNLESEYLDDNKLKYTYRRDGLVIDFFVEEGKISEIWLQRTDMYPKQGRN